MYVFQPDCTLPPTNGFIQSPNLRGSLDIVWSCLGVIILCTWSIIALPVPEQFSEPTASSDGGSRLKSIFLAVGRSLYLSSVKFGWMMFLLVLPEFALGKALSSYVFARAMDKRKRSTENASEQPWDADAFEAELMGWTAAHTMLADFGGFCVDFRQVNPSSMPGRPLQERSLMSGRDPTGAGVKVSEGVEPSKSSTGLQLGRVGKASRSSSRILTHIRHSQGMGSGEESVQADNLFTTGLDPNTAFSEDSRLTNFIDSQEHSLVCLGGFDWHSCPEHREIINQLEAQGSIGEWPARKFEDWARAPLYTLVGDRWTLNAAQILLAAERRLIPLPQPSEKDIKDKSKTSALVTLLSVIQILQLIIGLAVRGGKGQEISQLEVMTAAYAICAIAIYLLQWECPKDVGVPILVPALRRASAEDVLCISQLGRAGWWWGGMLRGKSHTISYLWTPGDSQSHNIGTLIGFIIFGSLHSATWNFAFPTAAEREAWLIASLVITVVPVVILMVVALLSRRVPDNTSNDSDSLWLFWSLWPMITVSYIFILARLLLIVEAFRSLYFAPPGVYKDTDFSSFPGFR